MIFSDENIIVKYQCILLWIKKISQSHSKNSETANIIFSYKLDRKLF